MLLNYPILVFAISLFALWLSARIGASRRTDLEEGAREDFGVIRAATLTLLGLIIGFTFAMAINRYDERKRYEEAEANAIGTELVRADLLPPADATKVRALLRSYLDQRILFYRFATTNSFARPMLVRHNCRESSGRPSWRLP
jgi:hypothetical protein